MLDSPMETQPHEPVTLPYLAGDVRTPSPDLAGEQHVPLTATASEAFATLDADYETASAKVCSGWYTQALESWLLCMKTLPVKDSADKHLAPPLLADPRTDCRYALRCTASFFHA